jgi:hypothetical protein
MAYDFVGKQFGYLTVVKRLQEREIITGRVQWECKCLCGNYKILTTYRLTDKKKGTITCGKCEWHIKHKEAYITWCAMKQRCNDTNHKDYKNYGGRGIKYDIRWFNFQEFFIDMGDPPIENGIRLSLERINNNDNYSKENCIWANTYKQANNKRNSILLKLESNGGSLIK